jgi:hypothetical protein
MPDAEPPKRGVMKILLAADGSPYTRRILACLRAVCG